ncbi:general odorant-binding protein 2-like [Cydia amplana]|uniref:general odorant-binding protein 2-like n=1 Tax=Cydia amplana TaxID=1869771 RepID=UPI002FE616B7
MVIVFDMALCWVVLALFLAAGEMEATSEESIIMSRITADIGKGFESCREETQLSPEIMKEWYQLWDYDFEVAVHREIGCTIICMGSKNLLLDNDNRVDGKIMLNYLRTFDNGGHLASKVAELYQNCDKQHKDIEDVCSRVIKSFACFKIDVKKAGIAPYAAMIEDMLEELS